MREHRELQTLIDQLEAYTREQDEAIKALQKTNEYFVEQLKQAVLAEREACAKLLETQIDFKGLDSQPQFLKFALDLITGCANLIRARGGK